MTDRDLTIRPIRTEDEPVWRQLWAGYPAYCETTLPEKVYGTTFARLLSGARGEVCGLLAVRQGIPAGLVHSLFHPSSWSVGETCCLQDLFTLPQARRTGVARALTGAVCAEADRNGTPAVYWMTASMNATARPLYDRVGQPTPFLQYERMP